MTSDSETEHRPWTVNTLAAEAGVSRAYIRQILNAGRLSGVKHGEGRGGFWEIPYQEGVRWLESRKT